MKRALIDTDILSYYFKGNPIVIKHFESYLDFFDSIEATQDDNDVLVKEVKKEGGSAAKANF
jgi:hypothetical protein